MCPVDPANAYRFTGISVEMNDNFFFSFHLFIFFQRSSYIHRGTQQSITVLRPTIQPPPSAEAPLSSRGARIDRRHSECSHRLSTNIYTKHEIHLMNKNNQKFHISKFGFFFGVFCPPIFIEPVSAGGCSARPARLGVHPIWWRRHGNTKSISKVQSSDV